MKTIKEIIREHLKYRKQIWKLAKTDLGKTYKGSALGWAWALVKPIITISVFWFAFTCGLRCGGDVLTCTLIIRILRRSWPFSGPSFPMWTTG